MPPVARREEPGLARQLLGGSLRRRMTDRIVPSIASEDAWEASPGWKWMPMASNLQMVFYRDKSGEVLVKVLYNEKEMRIKGLTPVQWPYYRWQDLKERLTGRTFSAIRQKFTHGFLV